jgi:hypothetical protein
VDVWSIECYLSSRRLIWSAGVLGCHQWVSSLPKESWLSNIHQEVEKGFAAEIKADNHSQSNDVLN